MRGTRARHGETRCRQDAPRLQLPAPIACVQGFRERGIVLQSGASTVTSGWGGERLVTATAGDEVEPIEGARELGRGAE